MIQKLGLFLGILCFSHLANAFENRPFIIAIAGGSASGKSYIAGKIAEALGKEQTTIVSMDNYFAPERQPEKFYRDGSINYDHPSAVDLESLASHIKYIRSGYPVHVKEYTYGQKREQKIFTYAPNRFVIVEGIFTLYPEVAALADLKIFVDVSREVRLRSRIERDQKERGLKASEVIEYFDRVVDPMHQRYVQTSAIAADVVITSPRDPEALRVVVDRVHALSTQTRQTKFSVLSDVYRQTIEKIAAENPIRYRVLELAKLSPTQNQVGQVNLAEKSNTIDRLVEESSLTLDLPSRLEAYLRKNPIPVVESGQRIHVVDHHHLIVALVNKGLTHFLVDMSVDPSTVAPERLKFAEQNPGFTFDDFINNPYRSLASILRNDGVIKNLGVPHAEFLWADYLQKAFNQKQIELTDEDLLRVDRKKQVVEWAKEMALDSAASGLPGYVGVERGYWKRLRTWVLGCGWFLRS